MNPLAGQIIDLYERHARNWDGDRNPPDSRDRIPFEKTWLDRFIAALPDGSPILDLGCGSAEPLAGYLIRRGLHVTGVDSATSMIDLARSRFPEETWLVADMRSLSLAKQFGGVMAWDSFFHLSPDDQRAMFPIFKAHAMPGAPLLFTTGPKHGEAIGAFRGEPLYHASLDESEYLSLLQANGFSDVRHVLEDPECGGHSVWLARRET